MAGIVAALKSNDHIEVFGKPIDEFTFAFVAPLNAHYDCICHLECTPENTASPCIFPIQSPLRQPSVAWY